MRGVVVVDQPQSDRVVVWHVNVGDGLDSTMAGAWVMPAADERVAGLLAGRLLVTTPAGSQRFGKGADVAELVTAISKEVAALDSAFTAHLNTLPGSRRSLVRPRWPQVPSRPSSETAGDPVASDALAVARWISALLVAWQRVEKQRLTRSFLLARGGDRSRDFPPSWPTTEPAEETV